MKITRIIALAAIAGISGAAGLQAQTLRPTSPPAEFPPASFKGKQYVDSRGCIYVRAGIDGNVTWVPRVSRSRKQICGYEPSRIAGSTKQRPAAPEPELITLDPGQQPAQTAQRPQQASAAPPRVVTTAKPQRTAQSTSARTAPAAPPPAAAAPASAKRVVRVKPAPAPAAAARPAEQAAVPASAGSGGCAGLSGISRQYSNDASARCGPQSAAPVTYGPQSSVRLTPNTRVVQAHIYQDRRLATGFKVPAGYRPVWDDGRLNPQRAERTVRPAAVSPFSGAPAGYEVVEREDGRMNPLRGRRTAAGDAQMARVWTDGVPRRLVQLPLDRPVVTLPRNASRSPAEAKAPPVLRLSTRSAPQDAGTPKARISSSYVRAATFVRADAAKSAARKLAAAGLPVRLGRLSRGGKAHSVVLAGPFEDQEQARAALAQVQAAGFSGARLSR